MRARFNAAVEPWTHLASVVALLGVALVLGALSERLRQSPILGYLLAGTMLGPNALGVVDDSDTVAVLAELGVALLLFTIGLEFSLRRLRRLGFIALGGGTLQIVLTITIAGGVALLVNRPFAAAVAIGAMVALSSTALVLRTLASRAEIESVHGRTALGILLMQDIAVVPLVLLVSVLGEGGTIGTIAMSLGRAVGVAALLILVLYGLINFAVPFVLGTETMQRNRELPLLLAILVGIGSALAAHKLGLSPALGAFVAGVLLAESPFSTQVRADVSSLRTLLMTLFFASVGLVGDPGWILQNLALVLAVTGAIVIGKSLLVCVTLAALRQPLVPALATGICLAQVGEFSFVLAEIAKDTVIASDTFKVMISATIGTLFLTPFLVAGAVPIASRVLGRFHSIGAPKVANAGGDSEGHPYTGHVLLIGFGPAGQAVGESLYRTKQHVVVVDLNRRMLQKASELGFRAIVGDATHPDVLEHAGVKQAAAVVITVPVPGDSRMVVQACRAIAPEAHLLVRARYHIHQLELTFAGAHVVVDEERQVGQKLAQHLRRHLRSRAAMVEDA